MDITVALPLAATITLGVIIGMAITFDPYDYIIRLEARIIGIEPAVTRTLELPRDLNFAQLHEVLQAAFGWTDSHLHQFTLGGLIVGAPEVIEDENYGPRVLEATEIRLRDLSFPYGATPSLEITYDYDFGDNWKHLLILRPTQPVDGVKYPRCIEGKRGCPPEDVGGTGGYTQFLEAWLDPHHEDHKANRQWAGRKFEPEGFDLDATNKAIIRAMRAARGGYRFRSSRSS